HLRSSQRLLRLLPSYSRLWLLGADVMDGHYSQTAALRRVALATMAAQLGLDVSILGFSFNERPSAEVVAALNSTPASIRFCLRDPLSYQRFVEHVCRPAELVSDLAFGLSLPKTLSAEERRLDDWIGEHKSAGRIVLAVCASAQPFASTQQPWASLAQV